MAGNLIAQQGPYKLFYDVEAKLVSLTCFGITYLTAKFHHDTADGASLLSNFQSYYSINEQLALLTANMLSKYLATQRTSKLFCIAGEFEKEFSGEDSGYRKDNIDRLMIKDFQNMSGRALTGNVCAEPITIDVLDPRTASEALKQQIDALLKQTYWGASNDEKRGQACTIALSI